MLGPDLAPKMRNMLTSGAKTLHYMCSQSVALWSSIILKKRDSVLSSSQHLDLKVKLLLRSVPLLESLPLFPVGVVQEVAEMRKHHQESSFLGDVVKLAQKASSRGQHTSSSSLLAPHKK